MRENARVSTRKNPTESKTKEIRPVIYQLFPRVFANVNSNLLNNGRISTNGCGKLNNINSSILKEIARLGVTHIWYTGIIEHAHETDYTLYGIARHNRHIIKGRAGSPYAITDYYDIDPDLAENVPERMSEFDSLVTRTKKAGMGVIIDFVPNHLGRQYASDSAPGNIEDFGMNDDTDKFFSPRNNFYYIPRQQFAPIDVDLGNGSSDEYVEFPAKATGNDCFTAFPSRNDWFETVKLNYGVDPCNGYCHFDPIPDTWMKMLHILRFWANKGVSGFRCDMAHMVPYEFWKWAISNVKKDYPEILFIAELYNIDIYRQYLEAGFDYLYDKVNLYDTLRDIRCSNHSAARLTSCWQTVDGISHKMLNFLENHDEQRFASDFYASDSLKVIPELVADATLSKGALMIYNGQELGEKGMDQEGFSGLDGRTTIFDYWSMDTVRRWLGSEFKPSLIHLSETEKRLRRLYSLILNAVNKFAAFREGQFFDLMYVNYSSPGLNPHRHFAYLRYFPGELFICFLNFDDSPAQADVFLPTHAFNFLNLPKGDYEGLDLLTSTKSTFSLWPDTSVRMEVAANSAALYRIELG